MIDGAMQPYALTLDKFLDHAATGKVDKLRLRSQYGQP